MKATDLADATARALHLLPPGDPANSDPRMLRDAGLAAESRLTRETAAEIWLAVSPLRVAPPDVLQSVLADIHPLLEANPIKARRYLTWVAASGWAAAAAVAISLWPKPAATLSPALGKAAAPEPQSRHEGLEKPAAPQAPRSRDTRLRDEVVRLQKRLATLQDDHVHRVPRVMSLSAPGAVRRTQEEARQHVQSVLTNALRSALEAASGAPSDPAALVIERGWLPGGLPVPDDGGVIRHRNFPEQAWQELGLSRSANGEYFDAASSTIWSADPEGRGFIGRKIAAEDDVTRFTKKPDQIAVPAESKAMPEGFMIENVENNSTEIFVENVPPLPAGKKFIVRVTDAAGTITDIPLTQTGDPPAEGPPAQAAPGTTPTDAELVPGLNQIASINTSSTPLGLSPTNNHFGAFSVGGDRFISATTFLAGASITSNPVNLSATPSSISPSGIGDSGTTYGNIVGYMYGGSLILNAPNGTIPAGFQLLEGELIPTGRPAKIIVDSGP